jgi:tRNA (adenine37-N6)-methyltransferase
MEPAKYMNFEKIGVFHSNKKRAYEAARQPAADSTSSAGFIQLDSGKNFEQGLTGLSTFSHIWLLYQFHQKNRWKPMVLPPRGRQKVGVFASRSPYRPNHIGMSSVELIGIRGLRIDVRNHDILDGTPILDIKPYLAYTDAIVDAKSGWLVEDNYQVQFSSLAKHQLKTLKNLGVHELEAFLLQQLSAEPFNKKKKRVKDIGLGRYVIAYRTWRAVFSINKKTVKVLSFFSGYSAEELQGPADPYLDKPVHRVFNETSP